MSIVRDQHKEASVHLQTLNEFLADPEKFNKENGDNEDGGGEVKKAENNVTPGSKKKMDRFELQNVKKKTV